MNISLPTSIWGSGMWTALYACAFTFPDSPTAEQINHANNYYNSLTHLLPCHECREHYSESLLTLPVEQASNSRINLWNWLQQISNNVNTRLEKEPFDATILWNYFDSIKIISDEKSVPILMNQSKQQPKQQPIVQHPISPLRNTSVKIMKRTAKVPPRPEPKSAGLSRFIVKSKGPTGGPAQPEKKIPKKYVYTRPPEPEPEPTPTVPNFSNYLKALDNVFIKKTYEVPAVVESPKEAVVQVVTEAPKESVKESQVVTEAPKESVKESQVVTEAPKASVKESQVVTESPKESVKESQIVTESPKESVKESQVVIEAPKQTVIPPIIREILQPPQVTAPPQVKEAPQPAKPIVKSCCGGGVKR